MGHEYGDYTVMDRLRLRNDIPGHNATETSPTAEGAGDAGRLTVGRDIALNGEIGSCHDLVVEGTVQAELKDGVNLEISETGLFKGNVDVQNADISGRFEGTLVVRNQLLIRPSAIINGTIEYGIVEIQPGARVNGTLTAREVQEMVFEQPAENVEYMEQPQSEEAHSPVADQNPGAVEDADMNSIISRIEDNEDQNSLPFRNVANG